MKEDIAGGSLALTTFLGSLLIIPAAWIALWTFPRGRLIPDFRSVADLLTWPIGVGSCLYPFFVIWAIRRGWRLYHEGRYGAAFRTSLAPWLAIGL